MQTYYYSYSSLFCHIFSKTSKLVIFRLITDKNIYLYDEIIFSDYHLPVEVGILRYVGYHMKQELCEF